MVRPKNEKDKYSCVYCDYITSYKCDWNKHLKTAKHKKNLKVSFKISKNSQNLILCNFCEKTYKHLSSYSRHKKKCENSLHKKDANLRVENANLEAEKDGDKILVSKKHLNDIIKTYVEKQYNFNNCDVNNNNITINMYLNEHCKNALNIEDFIKKIKITLEDLIESKNVGYTKGISNILINNLNDIPTLERPIHCTDKKKLEFMVKKDNEWNKDVDKDIDKIINSIGNERIQKLAEWKKENPNYLKDDKLYEIYSKIIYNIMDSEDDEKCIKNIKKDLCKNTDIDKAISEIK
jgi:hypothetical protein